MGILNVTPDSFSDGSRFNSVDAALKHTEKMIQSGADIIDIGGESTRPGAEPVELDKGKIGNSLNGKVVFVTGAAGSIGSGLCQQICRYSPAKIILFERAESPLYELDLDLKKKYLPLE